MRTSWEPELAKLLKDLLAVQDELLAILARKRELLVASDAAGLAALGPEEERIAAALQQWVERREALLVRAGQEGLPNGSIRALATALPREQQGRLDGSVRTVASRARLLRHQSLTNWVVIQKTLLHLSQVLEILATGGRLQPTYGGGEGVRASGTLVDRAA
jgi:hypothetical protein